MRRRGKRPSRRRAAGLDFPEARAARAYRPAAVHCAADTAMARGEVLRTGDTLVEPHAHSLRTGDAQAMFLVVDFQARSDGAQGEMKPR